MERDEPMAERHYVITPERTAAYARLTDDFNPLHLDPAFAASTPFGRPIAHGTHALCQVWASVLSAAGGDGLAGRRVSVRFRAPVYVGEPIEARTVGAVEDGANEGETAFEIVAGEARVAIAVTLVARREGDDAGA